VHASNVCFGSEGTERLSSEFVRFDGVSGHRL
jgi:hypothetical protein